jgi:uncharacterized protein
VNRLAREKSPYLLQHAGNPVDWFPWGREAFDEARRLDRPIFLSIGYATCHWCHVMERECFEDREVAALMNRTFVSVKVDREERPDVDEQYMTACTLLTGSGGWPLTIVMTPEGTPFFAATYVPRRSMAKLVPEIDKVWRERRVEVVSSAASVLAALRKTASGTEGGELPDASVLDRAFDELRLEFDAEHGGFGPAPKFPTPHILTFLLRRHRRAGSPEALAMAERTLVAMRRGGIWDHVGFGFHRYSTDDRWLVPHWEKMLYDQALLALAYTEAYQCTGREGHAATARETLEYVERDLLLPGGAFASAEDADSEGAEGKFYLWSHAELKDLLAPEELAELERVSAVAPAGNHDERSGEGGGNIIHLVGGSGEIAPSVRRRLFERRRSRVRPLRDDKVLADWNGLAIAAFARASRALGDERLAGVAARAADFLLAALRTPSGGLLHRYRDGDAAIGGFATDYAFLCWGLIELYEATGEPRHLRSALDCADGLVRGFVERDVRGGASLSLTARDGEPLLVRPRSASDGAVPSAASVAVLCLLRLGRMTGRNELEETARSLLRSLSAGIARQPRAFTFLLVAVDLLLGPSREIVVTGRRGAADTEALLGVVRRAWLPDAVTLFVPAGDEESVAELAPFVRALGRGDARARAYVCRDHACELPVTEPEELDRRLAT